MADLELHLDRRLPQPLAWWEAVVRLTARCLPRAGRGFAQPIVVALTPDTLTLHGRTVGGLHDEMHDGTSQIRVTVPEIPAEPCGRSFWVNGLVATLAHELWHAFEFGHGTQEPLAEEEERAGVAAAQSLAILFAVPTLVADRDRLLAELDGVRDIGVVHVTA